MTTALALGFIGFGVLLGGFLTFALAAWIQHHEEMAKTEMDAAARTANAMLERIVTARVKERQEK